MLQCISHKIKEDTKSRNKTLPEATLYFDNYGLLSSI